MDLSIPVKKIVVPAGRRPGVRRGFGGRLARWACLALGLFGLAACVTPPPREPEVAWTQIPGVSPSPDEATARLIEVLWRQQEKSQPGRFRRFLPPVRTLAVGAVVSSVTAHRTLLSDRLEDLLVRHLKRVSGLPVSPRREMVRWEEDLLQRGAQVPLSFASYREETSLDAAELAAVDAVVLGKYQVAGREVAVSLEFIRMTPALDHRTLTLTRARVSFPLGAVPLSEVIAPFPARKRDILPQPPSDWLWNPISVWYEVIKVEGTRSRGMEGAVLSPTDVPLVSFMAARPLYVMVLRLDSEGEVRVLFPPKAADLSEPAEVGRRYAVPDRLNASSRWAAAYVLFSDQAFRYRRDVLPALGKVLGKARAGASQGMVPDGLLLPSGIHQRRLWFTQLGERSWAEPSASNGRATRRPRP